MASKQSMYSLDYAYVTSDSGEIKNIHFSLSVDNDQIDLVIDAEEEMLFCDIEHVLLDIEKNNLKRMKVSILNDVTVIIHMNRAKYIGKLAEKDNTFVLEEIIPVTA